MTTSGARPSGPVFEVTGLGYTYPGAAEPALSDLSFSIERGEVLAVIGPNGSGKSTLLRLLLGTLEPSTGSVLYRDRQIDEWGRRTLALEIGAVPQTEEINFPLTVRELVAMGRYPHLGPWRREGEADLEAVDDALRRCAVEHLRDRALDTLSGGELQRARIARALAQEPETLVLDEPTAALDIHHEMAIFELMTDLAEGEGVTIVVVTHNLNLAARFADRIILLDRGTIAGIGAPEEVIIPSILEGVYQWPLIMTRHPGPGRDTGAPQVAPRRARPPDTQRMTLKPDT